MTEGQRTELIALFPEAADKIHCLSPVGSIDHPTGKGPTAFLEMAGLLQQLVGDRLNTLGIMEPA